MAEIKCPMCGKPNPAVLEVCQFCEARLKPVTDELSRSQPPIHPGDEPTFQDTGELEPVLPQWLREVRQQARESAEENDEQVPAEEEAPQPQKTGDFLAGLQSQTDDDEEIPDWLSGLRGESTQSMPKETSQEDEDLSALKSMLGADTSDVDESEAGALPDWMSDLGGAETKESAGEDILSALLAASADQEQPASSSDFEWSADFGAGTGALSESSKDDTPMDVGSGLTDLLRGIDEPTGKGTGSDLPAWESDEGEQPAADQSDSSDWLASLGEQSPEPTSQESAQSAVEGSLPDWLASLDSGTTEPDHQESAQPALGDDAPDWLASLGEESTGAIPSETEQPALEDDTPDWLASLGEESTREVSAEPEQPASGEDTPDWLASLSEETTGTITQESAHLPFEEETPDWLASLGGENEPTGADESTPEPPFADISQPAEIEETPDWLSSLGEEVAEPEQPELQANIPANLTEEFGEEIRATPAFVDDGGAPLATEDVDAIFSMDMPDWLSETGSAEQASGKAAMMPADDDLRPADLPSWVQAMRPVESVMSETEGGIQEEQPIEQKGPLAGLRGVLPAVPGVGPSSKPKAYSLKLQASEDQQSNASMLEQMLATEIHPEPITTQRVVSSQRILRWVIAVLLLLVVGGSVFSGTQLNPMPVGAPIETSAAMRFIQESLPANGSVLMVFDYEAALAGEMEAAAAPFVDHMLLLKHPRLSLISSTPTGTGLAERFMRDTQDSHNYQEGQQLANLGYLPGGAAGILAFAENPVTTKPKTITGENAWNTPALQGVRQLSDFSAIILLTNDGESARIWIEQTQAARKDTQFLVISSAQSGPMILPYVQTGQVDGMVTGLDGSAPIENVNDGRPGMVRRYWDAYGLGLLTALSMISIGSLWSLVAGWQARRKEQGEA